MPAFTSKGYNGDIGSLDWPLMKLSPSYYVANPTDLVCTVVSGATRQVSISAGECGGFNVRDKASAATTLTLGQISSGTSYYPIYATRTWASNSGSTDLSVGAAITNPGTLPTRNTNPGTLDDQPLWLVPQSAGVTTPGTPIDLRVIGAPDGQRYIRDARALQYLTDLGTEVWLGDVKWRRRLNAAGTGSEWVQESSRFQGSLLSGSQVMSPSTGFSGTNVTIEAYTDSGTVDLYVELKRTGAVITFSDQQGQVAGGDPPVCTLTTAARPKRPRLIAFEYMSTANATCGGTMILGSDGICTVLCGTAGTSMRSSTSDTWDLRFSDTYNQRAFSA